MNSELTFRAVVWSSREDQPLPPSACLTHDENLIREDVIEVPVQVNGKLRGKITVPAGTAEVALQAAALADERIQGAIAGKQVRKVIVAGCKLVNIVVSDQ